MAKQEYHFSIDRKVTVWVRETHWIEAESYEDACKEMIETFHDNLCESTFTEQEHLYETEEIIEPGDNNGHPTIELIGQDGELLTDNIKII